MSTQIPINRIGIIETGIHKGWQVKVELQSSDSEECLILISTNFDDPQSEGYDDWVENFDSLEQYFRESKWLVTWF